VTGVELVIGYLIAWAVRKARRVGARIDAEVDQALDAGVDRLHELVGGELGGDPALRQLEDEAQQTGKPSDRTQARVKLALDEAMDTDPFFRDALNAALQQVLALEKSATAGDQGVAIAGDVTIKADNGSAAAFQMGNVSLSSPDPSRPDRT